MLPTGRRRGRPEIKYEKGRRKGGKAEDNMLRRNKPATMEKCDREPVTGGTMENWIDRDTKSGVFHVYQLILNPIIKQWQPAPINTSCYINTLITIISVTI